MHALNASNNNDCQKQSKGLALEGKIWPRLSALAERLWTDPETGWRLAETRLHIQRERWES